MTTRYKIAEQVLRIINGGDSSEDSSVDIREIMLLVDQERNSLIKTEIMDWMYTKSTATAKGELEINGAWLSHAEIPVGTDTGDYGDGISPVMAPLDNLISTNHISLPNDMGIQRVASGTTRFDKMEAKVSISGTINPIDYIKSKSSILFTRGPKVMDKKYDVSFNFYITETTMSDGSTTEYLHHGVKKHSIKFTVDTEGHSKYDASHVDFLTILINSDGFQKFVKDFDVEVKGHTLDAYNELLDTQTSLAYTSSVELRTRYGSALGDFKINNIGGTYSASEITETGGTAGDTDNSLGFGWSIIRDGGSVNDDSATESAGENSHGVSIVINNTIYSVDFIASDSAVTYEDVQYKFVHTHSDRLAREQNIVVEKGLKNTATGQPSTLNFSEIEPRGGFTIDVFTPGSAFFATIENKGGRPPTGDPSATGYKSTVFTRMPSGGDHNSLYDKTVNKSGRIFWYIDSFKGVPKIYFYKQYSLDRFTQRFGTTVMVTYIGTSESIGDHDPYPVPSDYEKIIIKNLVEMFSIMKKAKEDMANDNID